MAACPPVSNGPELVRTESGIALSIGVSFSDWVERKVVGNQCSQWHSKGGAYKKPKRTTMKFLKVNLLEIQILCSNWTPVTTKRGVNKIYATLSSTFPRETWVSFSNGNMLTVPKDNSYSAKHIEHICNEWVGICVRESSLRFVSKLPLASTAPPFQLDFMECLVIQVLFVATYKFTPQTNHQMKILKTWWSNILQLFV